MEATESPSLVLGYYDELLRADSANAVRTLPSPGSMTVALQVTYYRPYGNDAYLFFAAWIK